MHWLSTGVFQLESICLSIQTAHHQIVVDSFCPSCQQLHISECGMSSTLVSGVSKESKDNKHGFSHTAVGYNDLTFAVRMETD